MKTQEAQDLTKLPSIEKLVSSENLRSWDQKLVRAARVRLAQELVVELREQVRKGTPCPEIIEIEKKLERKFEQVLEIGLKKVINATGVLLHTNLGRAPLGKEALSAMMDTLSTYCSLEFDLESGTRGSRTSAVERLVELVTGVPAALVVNNNAASVFLILHALANGKQVIISRGELIQIGGGFRIPEILKAGGAKLCEVGTTNMTDLSDYEKGIESDTALILKVHQSNFAMLGHTEEVSLSEIVQLCKKKEIYSVMDLGSGYLRAEDIKSSEPTVEDILRTGVDLVCFSADKLVGGPQAGFVVGERKLISTLKKSPLYRALRLGKTELFLLEFVLKNFLTGKLPPVWQRLNESLSDLQKRCERVSEKLKTKIPQAKVIQSVTSVGGGTMPDCHLPSFAIELPTSKPEVLAKKLRVHDHPVVVRIDKDKLLLDLRSVFPDEENDLVQGVMKVWE